MREDTGKEYEKAVNEDTFTTDKDEGGAALEMMQERKEKHGRMFQGLENV